MRPGSFIGLVSLIFVYSTGCSLQPVVKQTTRTDTVIITEIDRDTALFTLPDSALIRAYFECDSLNRVVMTRLEQQSGRKVEQVVLWKNSIIEVIAAIDSQEVYFAWKEKHVLEKKAEQSVVIEPAKNCN